MNYYLTYNVIIQRIPDRRSIAAEGAVGKIISGCRFVQRRHGERIEMVTRVIISDSITYFAVLAFYAQALIDIYIYVLNNSLTPSTVNLQRQPRT